MSHAAKNVLIFLSVALNVAFFALIFAVGLPLYRKYEAAVAAKERVEAVIRNREEFRKGADIGRRLFEKLKNRE